MHETPSRRDFFISYTSADKQWAEWIGFTLEAAGYSVFLQDWDFRPGSNFVSRMDEALSTSDKTILVVSPRYLKSAFARAEWTASFARDAAGTEARTIPFRVEKCRLKGLLTPLVYVDLLGLPEAAAKSAVLGAFQTRTKPEASPLFPPSAAYPGGGSPQGAKLEEILSTTTKRFGSSDSEHGLSPKQRLSIIDKLVGLSPQQFNMLLFAFSIPAGVVPPMPEPQVQRAKRLVDWADTESGAISELIGLLGIIERVSESVSGTLRGRALVLGVLTVPLGLLMCALEGKDGALNLVVPAFTAFFFCCGVFLRYQRRPRWARLAGASLLPPATTFIFIKFAEVRLGCKYLTGINPVTPLFLFELFLLAVLVVWLGIGAGFTARALVRHGGRNVRVG